MTIKYDWYIDYINNTLSIRELEIPSNDELVKRNIAMKTAKGEHYCTNNVFSTKDEAIVSYLDYAEWTVKFDTEQLVELQNKIKLTQHYIEQAKVLKESLSC